MARKKSIGMVSIAEISWDSTLCGGARASRELATVAAAGVMDCLAACKDLMKESSFCPGDACKGRLRFSLPPCLERSDLTSLALASEFPNSSGNLDRMGFFDADPLEGLLEPNKESLPLETSPIP